MSNKIGLKALSIVVGFAAVLALAAGSADLNREVQFSIPAQRLSDAVILFSDQTGIQVVTAGEDLTKFSTAGVSGKLAIGAGLTKLLEGTALRFETVGDSTVAVTTADGAPGAQSRNANEQGLAESTAASTRASFSGAVRRAQADSNVEGETAPNAETEGEGKVEEIVVTAQKRVERLLDVPQSVSVLTSNDLAKLGAVQFRDFANTVPALTFASGGVGQTQISLRGVTAGFDVAPTIGIYVDEVPYGSSTTFANGARVTLDVGLFDVDRIEVLRGPQGTLYGASTMGGLIKYVSKLPNTNRFGVDAQAGISSTEEGGVSYNVSGVVNAPLVSDKMALRASAFQSRDGGYIDNLARDDEDVNRSDVYGGRLDLLFTPSDALTIRLGSFLQNISREGQASADFLASGEPLDESLEQRRLLAEPYDQQFRLVSGTIGYDFGGAALTSVSSYQTMDGEFDVDVSGRFVSLLALPLFGSRAYSAVLLNETVNTDKFVQEVRLASEGARLIEWVIGGFYTREKSHRTQTLLPRDLAGEPASADLLNFASPTHYEEYAAFGDLTWNLTDKFDVTGGLRYAENRQDFTQNASGILILPRPLNRSSEEVATYLANARYHFSRHAVGYLRFATGYRPGGPNFVVPNVDSPPTYEADRLKSYEVGFKAETDNQRFGMDLATYQINWDNIQVLANRGGLSVIGNSFGGATIRGAELSLTARPTGELSFSGAFAYQDATMDEADPPVLPSFPNGRDLRNREGERLPNVPRFVGTLSSDYRLPILSEWDTTVGATVRYVSDRTVSYDLSASPPQYQLPEYATADLRAGFTFGSITTQLYVRNLFDERGQLYMPNTVVNATNPRPVTILQPRTFGITLMAHF